MAEVFKTHVRGLNYPLFSIALASEKNLSSLQISDRIGIRCPQFIEECKFKYEAFKNDYTYSRDAVERFFNIKFCFLRIQNHQIRSFEDMPAIGSNVIYVHKK